ncbi:MAG: aldo/keto reductase [Verrucomicrobia bacterium]|nr:aldo/keto reductase [Verrucomicrobiota bacterium]MDA1087180.1 aldo/keto reductase [Verrucomicrobiota bacterium]
MKFGTVPGVEKRISRMLLGTMIVGASNYEESSALLDAAYEAGFNAFDTGHVYGVGLRGHIRLASR